MSHFQDVVLLTGIMFCNVTIARNLDIIQITVLIKRIFQLACIVVAIIHQKHVVKEPTNVVLTALNQTMPRLNQMPEHIQLQVMTALF